MSDDDDEEQISPFGIRQGSLTRELVDTDSEDDTSAFILKSKQVSKKTVSVL